MNRVTVAVAYTKMRTSSGHCFATEPSSSQLHSGPVGGASERRNWIDRSDPVREEPDFDKWSPTTCQGSRSADYLFGRVSIAGDGRIDVGTRHGQKHPSISLHGESRL
jgi:hypothetical protein